MKREALLKKVEELRTHGDSRFVVANNEDKYEFKAIRVNGEEFKVFGGFGDTLSVFNTHKTDDEIVNVFESALRLEKKTLESCIFVRSIF